MAAIISLKETPRRPSRGGRPAGGEAVILLFTGVRRETGRQPEPAPPGAREQNDREQ